MNRPHHYVGHMMPRGQREWDRARHMLTHPEHFPELAGLGRAERDPLDVEADERLDTAIRIGRRSS